MDTDIIAATHKDVQNQNGIVQQRGCCMEACVCSV